MFDFVTPAISDKTFYFTKEWDRDVLGIKKFHRWLLTLRKVGFVQNRECGSGRLFFSSSLQLCGLSLHPISYILIYCARTHVPPLWFLPSLSVSVSFLALWILWPVFWPSPQFLIFKPNAFFSFFTLCEYLQDKKEDSWGLGRVLAAN